MAGLQLQKFFTTITTILSRGKECPTPSGPQFMNILKYYSTLAPPVDQAIKNHIFLIKFQPTITFLFFLPYLGADSFSTILLLILCASE